MAVGAGGKAYAIGGYTAAGTPLRAAFVLERGAWRPIRRMPFPRAAAGAGVAGGKIVEEWANWDTLGMLQQIGAVPSEAPAQTR